MSAWHIAHLVCLAAWAGLVLGEGVMEVAGRRSPEAGHQVARLHEAIDLWVELPLLTGVLATGFVLLGRTNPDAGLWLKVALGLLAIAANLACVGFVLRRARLARDAARARQRWTRRIFLTAALGIPAAGIAFYLGGARLHWW